MAASTQAFFLFPPFEMTGTGEAPATDPMDPETRPAILWGQGTPAAIAPFTTVNKGSLYLTVNQTDDTTAVYIKVDEGGDADDWTRMFVEDQALIDTGDLATAAGIVTGQIAVAARTFIERSALFDISAADSEQVVLHAKAALTITRAYLLYNEATGASGAAEGDITIGTATGGNQIVAATAYAASKATGSVQNLTIASGAVAADGSVFASHDQATGAAGTCYLILEWDWD